MRLPCGIQRVQSILTVGFCLLGIVGCAPPAKQNYEPSAQVAKLTPENQARIQKILARQCGSPASPKLLGDRLMSPAHLKRGSEVTGDGNGPQAQYLIPKPRDYRRGIFKFTSTTYGSKPLRDDIYRTIKRGVLGTSMPSFDMLPPEDLNAVTDYVLALTHRGELEALLADAVEFEGELNEGAVPGMVETIQGQWKEALANVVNPRTPMPLLTRADAEAGKKIFLSIGCNKCHGDEGRGEVADELPPDIWGNPVKAADITAGMLRGGTDPLDVYRRIEAGINGTPMPAFRSQFEENPGEVWKLVAYVMSVYDMRRDGITPPSVIIKPLPGVKSAEARQSE